MGPDRWVAMIHYNKYYRFQRGVPETPEPPPSPLATPLTKVPDRQVGLSQFWLLSSLFLPSTMIAEAIQTRTNGINYWVLYSIIIVILEFELLFSDSQALRCLILRAIRDFNWARVQIELTVIRWQGRIQKLKKGRGGTRGVGLKRPKNDGLRSTLARSKR